MAKKKEELMTAVMESPAKNYGDLFRKISSLTGIEKQNFCKTLSKDEKHAYIQHLKERDVEKVTGIFRCFEPLGGSLEMTAMAYEGENPVKYSFNDGQTYTVPRYIAKRFESEFQGIGTWYPTHSHILDESGKPVVSVGKKNRRFGFSSMEYQ
jgi:hypothetical protein